MADPQALWGTELLRRLPLRGDECVLDAGCGSGRVTQRLEAQLSRGRVVALDASESMALAAKSRLRQETSIVVADLSKPLPLAEACFDAILSTATFHWIRDHASLYHNLAKVLRPGGRLVAQCGGFGNISTVVRALRDIGAEELDPWTFATADEAHSLLIDSGFEDVESWLHAEPTVLGSIDELADFLSTCVLNPWIERLPEVEKEPFARAVAQRLPGLKMDYVRLNLTARRRAE